MNKYKNKTLYRLIPIKAAVFFSVKSKELFIFSLCFVVLGLKNLNDFICRFCQCFIFIPLFTHSSLVLNLKEFLSSAEHKCYFEEYGQPNSCWSSVTSRVFFFLLSKSMWTSNCLVSHILQNVFLCVQHNKQINTGLGQHASE